MRCCIECLVLIEDGPGIIRIDGMPITDAWELMRQVQSGAMLRTTDHREAVGGAAVIELDGAPFCMPHGVKRWRITQGTQNLPQEGATAAPEVSEPLPEHPTAASAPSAPVGALGGL